MIYGIRGFQRLHQETSSMKIPIDLRKKIVKKMMQCSVKKEIIPQGTRNTSKPGEGALISFSVMEAFLDLFLQTRAFVSFVGTKEREVLLQAGYLKRPKSPKSTTPLCFSLYTGKKTS